MVKFGTLGLGAKLNLLSTGLILITALSIAGVVAWAQQREGYDALRENGRRLSLLLARAADNALLVGHQSAYDAVVGAVGADVDVAYVELLDAAGRPLARRSEQPQVPPPQLPDLAHMKGGSVFLPLGRLDERGDARYFDYIAPVFRTGDEGDAGHPPAVAGFIRLGVSDQHLQQALLSTFEWIFLVMGGTVVLGVMLTLTYTRRIIRPLETLTRAAHDVAMGRLDVAIEVHSHDEVADVARSFQTMVGNLRSSRNEVERSKETLEATVAQRTYELNERARDLARTQERLGLALDGSNLALWDWDLDSGRVFLSDRWNVILGGTARQTITTLNELIALTHPDDAGKVADSGRRMVKGLVTHYSVEHRVRNEDGKWRWILSRGKVVERNADGRAVRAIGTNSDITPRKHEEEELRRARDSAEAATQSKSQFLATMSHEIRTPLNEVLGMTELLLDSGLTPDQHELAETVARSGEHLLQIINDILDFSKIEAGKLDLEHVVFNLRDAMADVIELFGPSVLRSEISLSCDIAPDVPTHAIGDPARLKQILVNLVGNAIKFTHRGSVSVEVVLLDREDQRAHIEFRVRDTGIGIPPEAQARIFETFSQADGGTTRKYGGTGLGLAIVRQLTLLMGGGIALESKPGQGSTFTVWLHLDVALAPIDLWNGGSAQPRVLIVDPSDTDRSVLAQHLLHLGLDSHETRTGAEALDYLKVAEPPCNVVILNSRLDEADGMQVARDLRGQLPLARRPRIAIVSDTAAQADRSLLAELDIAGWIGKPVRREALRLLFEKLFPGTLPVRPDSGKVDTFPGARILLVEDNSVNQMVATGMLQTAGCKVEVAANGLEALERLGRNRYELVLMDCQMPEMDGYAATAQWRLREAHSGRHQLIVALTANAMEGDRERCVVAGMDDYLAKPFRREQMLAVLRRHLRGVESGVKELRDPGASESADPQIDPAPLEGLRQLERNGAVGLVTKVVQAWIASSGELIGKLESSLMAGDRREFHRAAHTLKSSSANVGAATVSALAKQLETDAATELPIGSTDLIRRLASERLLAAAALKRVIQEKTHAPV